VRIFFEMVGMCMGSLHFAVTLRVMSTCTVCVQRSGAEYAEKRLEKVGEMTQVSRPELQSGGVGARGGVGYGFLQK
jgi:hypothetical protein